MKIINKQFKFAKTSPLTVENIENLIKAAGFIPLRWAIVKVEEDFFLIDAAVQFADCMVK